MDKHYSQKAAHCFIHTPFDYLCLREYLHRSPCEVKYLYLIATSERSAKQLDTLVAADRWTRVISFRRKQSLTGGAVVKLVDKFSALLHLVLRYVKLSCLLYAIKPGNTVVLSVLSSPISRLVLKRSREMHIKPIVIDNGLGTFNQFAILSRDGALTVDSIPSSKSFLSRVEKALFPRQAISCGDVQYFSMLPLQIAKGTSKPDILPRNDFPLLQAKSFEIVTRQTVFFLGQPHVRSGMLTKKQLIAIIRKISEFYSASGRQFVYFPHPGEDADILREECNVVTPDEPFETYVLSLKVKPAVIATFYSTAVLTSYYLLGNKIEYVFFWGFDELATKRLMNREVEQLIRYEAAHTNCIMINEQLK